MRPAPVNRRPRRSRNKDERALPEQRRKGPSPSSTMNLNIRHIVYPGADTPISVIGIEAHWSLRKKSNGFCISTWRRFIRRVAKDPNCYVVIVGDWIDADRPTTRERKLLMGMGRPEVLDEEEMEHQFFLKHNLIEDLLPIKDRIIGAVDGDHFKVYSDGTTSTQFILKELGCPEAYLGQRMGWIRLVVNTAGRMRQGAPNGGGIAYHIFVRHGKGAAATPGADVNALLNQSTQFDADLHMAGHTHKQWFFKVPHLYCGKYDVKQRYVAYARAGSLLRGFIYGQPTYAELAEYKPLSIGWPEIQLWFTRRSRRTATDPRQSGHNIELKDVRGIT